MTDTNEIITLNGLEIRHTFRGHNNEIEVYTYQDGNFTYSLYKKPASSTWACDWATSYNIQPVTLEANPADGQAMLNAFAAMLKAKLAHAGGH